MYIHVYICTTRAPLPTSLRAIYTLVAPSYTLSKQEGTMSLNPVSSFPACCSGAELHGFSHVPQEAPGRPPVLFAARAGMSRLLRLPAFLYRV